MTIEAKIVADSIGPRHPRLTTFELRYPRFIHAELMTHRMFSRNASSSRAIPVERQIEAIIEDTAMPIHWGKNQSGMQAAEESDAPLMVPTIICTTEGREILPVSMSAEEAWLEARDRAIEVARAFVVAGYHKQVVNRILEPFTHIKVVVSATNFANWFWLRSHPDAQPEIKALSDMMLEAYRESKPRLLGEGDWHLPYVTEDDLTQVVQQDIHGMSYDSVVEYTDISDLIKVSVARCARVSYKTHDGAPTTVDSDIALYDRLVGSAPLHASPAEHQARLDDVVWNESQLPSWARPDLSGNFDKGWIQFRKTLDGEHIANEDPLSVEFD